MQRPLTIIMYHYVRELEHSRYPDIKGLSVDDFKGQLDYVLKHYTVVTAEECIAYLGGESASFPCNAALLTFDDGYLDHFTNVFPILYGKGAQGAFFPVAKAVQEHCVLDVNKIHFTLASVEDKSHLVRQVFSLLDELRPNYDLHSNEHYYQLYSQAPSRFDSPDVMFIKGFLQKGLTQALRGEVLDELFQVYVSQDEAAFAKELYVSADQLACMRKAGMYVGSHSWGHHWLDTVSPSTQEQEIEMSLRLLDSLDCDLNNWGFNYPYGAYNDSLLSLLQGRGCRFGLTTKVGIADLDRDEPLLLPRLDTNDLPKNGQAEPNEWTSSVIRLGANAQLVD